MLLSERGLVRRRDEVAVIGAALVEMIGAGRGHRPVAAQAGLPACTVRGWRRAFAGSAEAIRAHFARWAHALDPGLGRVAPAGDAAADALEAVAVAARAWVLRFGSRPLWGLVCVLSGGVLLCNTSCPFPAVAEAATVRV
ncbi:MAG: helix-turn-helix domain-containing protein [Solirubrobacteraceae bacterium]